MNKDKVRVEHFPIEPGKNGGWDNKARIWINDTEVVGVISYDVDAGIDRGIGVYQKFTVEMWAQVTITHAEAAK